MAADELNGLEIFDMLVLGVAEFLLNDLKYPYPASLQQAWNQLSLITIAPMTPKQGQKLSFPRTLSGFLTLMERPVEEWFPWTLGEENKKLFDSDASLLYDRRLSEEASRYLYEELLERPDLLERASPLTRQVALDNRHFQVIWDRLRSAYTQGTDQERIQQVYVTLRSFLIEHPYTTGEALRRAFIATMPLLSPDEVGKMYERCPPHEKAWRCDHCGPLTEHRAGVLRGLRPSVCDNHHLSLPNIHSVLPKTDMRRVKLGIHWRVTLPGIPEMRLFHALQVHRTNHPDLLQSVNLWPGVDRYDLQIAWGDNKVWAVDVKDWADPDELAGQLDTMYGEGNDLRYDKAFYVIPERRVRAREGYLAALDAETRYLPNNHCIVSLDDFEDQVASHLARLKKGAKRR